MTKSTLIVFGSLEEQPEQNVTGIKMHQSSIGLVLEGVVYPESIRIRGILVRGLARVSHHSAASPFC